MITEKDVWEAVPSEGFVHDFLKFAETNTVAHLAFQLNSALTTLAVTCPIDYGFPYGGLSLLRPNMFCLSVAPAGERKSTAVGYGADLIKLICADDKKNQFSLEHPSSAEGLIDALAENPRSLWSISEFGEFLTGAKRNHLENLKPLLNDLWDATPRSRARAGRRVVSLPNPRLSIHAGCSLTYLEAYTTSADWSGGFLSRWAIMYSPKAERVMPMPIRDDRLIKGLITSLKDKAARDTSGTYNGMTAHAQKLWNNWYYVNEERKLPDNIAGLRVRASTLALKVAMIYAWDWGLPYDTMWEMPEEAIWAGIRYTELHIKSVIGLSDQIADTLYAKNRRRCIDALITCKGRASMGTLMKMTKLSKKDSQQILESLVEEGSVFMRHNGSPKFDYVLNESLLEKPSLPSAHNSEEHQELGDDFDRPEWPTLEVE